MWRWDQGHLPYFQFDRLRQISAFVMQNDFCSASRSDLLTHTGLTFKAPKTHSPWRQYSRVLKTCLLVSLEGKKATPTPVAKLLAQPGQITCDEYLHFLARAFTDPSPVYQGWSPNDTVRYPLLFALKYLLAKQASARSSVSSIDEVLGAYESTSFTGEESDTDFIKLTSDPAFFSVAARSIDKDAFRQARESLLVLSQISYLHVQRSNVFVALDPLDAQEVFTDLAPIVGVRAVDRESEIRRLANLFRDGATETFFDYSHTIVADVVQAGFIEGTKVKKTHITIERNQELRKAFFKTRETATCDVCALNTSATYPWTSRILDLHHLLPLSSGTRANEKGTTFDDLVPICPSCHRAVHRYYDSWLNNEGLADFRNEQQARDVYVSMKAYFPEAVHG